MIKTLAHIVSWLFLPLLMPVYAIAVTMYIPSVEPSFYQKNTLYWLNPSFKLVVIAWFAIFSFIAPGLSLLILRYSNSISSIQVDRREERGAPITVTAMFCFILGVLFLLKLPISILYALPWGGFAAIVIAGFINRRDKISLHALGAGMLFGFFVSYYSLQAEYFFEILVISTLVCGLVLSARVYLGKHTLQQVFAGFGLGFICIFLSVLFFSYFT